MTTPLLLVLAYFIAPITIGTFSYTTIHKETIKTKIRKNYQKASNWIKTKSRTLSNEDLLSFGIFVLIGAYILLLALQLTTRSVSVYAVWTIVAFLILSFSILATIRYKLTSWYKNLSWPINSALVLLGIYVGNE